MTESEISGCAGWMVILLLAVLVAVGVSGGLAYFVYGVDTTDLQETVSFMQTQIAELSTPAPVCSTPEPTRVRPNDNFHLPTEIVKESNG